MTTINEQTDVIEADRAVVVHEPKYAEVAVSDAPQVIPLDQMPDLDEMTPGFSFRAQYREFQTKGEKVRAILIGFTTIKGMDGKEKKTARFQSKDCIWVNSGDNLIDQVHHLPLGTPLEITYEGTDKTSSGFNVKTFNVRLLTKPTLAQRQSKFLDWSASNRVNVNNMHDVSRSVNEIADAMGFALTSESVQGQVDELRKELTKDTATTPA